MKVTLNQIEIEKAIKDYMHSTFALKEGLTMKCEFTSTRGPMGILVEIDINAIADVAEPEPEKEHESDHIEKEAVPVHDSMCCSDGHCSMPSRNNEVEKEEEDDAAAPCVPVTSLFTDATGMH